ncbi:MAG TPA: low temperature requirement protein A [Chloroflexota bacterium]
MLLIFGLWWSYFKSSPVGVLYTSNRASFLWGYGHFAVFAPIAALGAGLQVAAESAQPGAQVDPTAAAFLVAVPVVVYVVVLGLLHRLTDRRPLALWPIGVAVALLLAAAAAARVVSLAGSVLLMGVIASLLVANYVYRLGRVQR